MVITNHSAQDLCFNIDVGKTVKVVSRLVIPANGNATVTTQDALLLVLMSTEFHAARAANTITVAYSAADYTYLGNIITFIMGGW